MFHVTITLVVLTPLLLACGQRSAPKVDVIERTDSGSDSGKPSSKNAVKREEDPKVEAPPTVKAENVKQRKEPAYSDLGGGPAVVTEVDVGPGSFQLYYDFKSLNKKDCLVANDPSGITVAPCTTAPNMGFSFKKIQGNTYQIISQSSGKCLQVNKSVNYKDPSGQALMQVPCAEVDAEAGTFSLDPASETTKISVLSLCIKLGIVSNAYLDQCEIAWTWFSRTKL